MKTTVEVPDNLYRQIKAQAALQGQTVKTFFIEALSEKLGGKHASPSDDDHGWKAVFGKGNKKELAEVQRIIDEGQVVDLRGWDLPQ